jgi:hypothetical protein
MKRTILDYSNARSCACRDHIGILRAVPSFRREDIRYWLVVCPPLVARNWRTLADCGLSYQNPLAVFHSGANLSVSIPKGPEEIGAFGRYALPGPFKQLRTEGEQGERRLWRGAGIITWTMTSCALGGERQMTALATTYESRGRASKNV